MSTGTIHRRNDKRSYMRLKMDADALISVHKQGRGPEEIKGVCLDLSPSGMSLRVEHPLLRQTEITVAIDSHNAQLSSFWAKGIIRSVRPDLTSRQNPKQHTAYIIGVEITIMK